MNKKAQVVIIIMWILVILAIIAVGVGHRVSMAIRLTAYQRDGAKALCLAEVGINRAIVELEKDKTPPNTDVDSLTEAWSTGRDSKNKALFENIEVKVGSGETFTIKYLYDKENNTYLCMADEERKININTAGEDLLQVLLNECGVTGAEEIAKNIAYWRGGSVTDPPDYKGLEGKAFSNIEELVLVKGIKDIEDNEPKDNEPNNLEKLMSLITVFGYDKGQVNINTAGKDVLRILFITAGAKNSQFFSNIDVDSLIGKILKYRDQQGNNFTNLNLANLNLGDSLGFTPEETSFVTNDVVQSKLNNLFKVKSDYFRIISTGKISASDIERTIECVYDRGNKKVVFWHES